MIFTKIAALSVVEYNGFYLIEVLLCVLLESFRFTPDVDIEWHIGFVMSPFASGDVSESKLPLHVENIGV